MLLEDFLGPLPSKTSASVAPADEPALDTEPLPTLTADERLSYRLALRSLLCPAMEIAEEPVVTATTPTTALKKQLRGALDSLVTPLLLGKRGQLSDQQRELLYNVIVSQCKLQLSRHEADAVAGHQEQDERIFHQVLDAFVKDLEAEPVLFQQFELNAYITAFGDTLRRQQESLYTPTPTSARKDSLLSGIEAAFGVVGLGVSDAPVSSGGMNAGRREVALRKIQDRVMMRLRDMLSALKQHMKQQAGEHGVAALLQVLQGCFGVDLDEAGRFVTELEPTCGARFATYELQQFVTQIKQTSDTDFASKAEHIAWQKERLVPLERAIKFLQPACVGPTCKVSVSVLGVRGLTDFVGGTVYISIKAGDGTRWESSRCAAEHQQSVIAWAMEQCEFDIAHHDNIRIRVKCAGMLTSSTLGEYVLHAKQLQHGVVVCDWYPLVGKAHGDSIPEIQLQLVYTDVAVYKIPSSDLGLMYQTLYGKLVAIHNANANAKTNAVPITPTKAATAGDGTTAGGGGVKKTAEAPAMGFGVLSKQAKTILQQFALRYGLCDFDQYCVQMRWLMQKWETSISFLNLAFETLKLLAGCSLTLSITEQQHRTNIMEDIVRITQQQLRLYHSIFFQNQPAGALNRVCDIYSAANMALGKSATEGLEACIRQAHERQFESVLMKATPTQATAVGVYEPRDLIPVCDAVVNAVFSDSSFFEHCFPGQIELVHLSATNMMDKLFETIGALCERLAEDVKALANKDVISTNGDLFRLYFKTVHVQESLSDFLPNRSRYPLTVMFHPFIAIYLDQLVVTMQQWVDKACDLDKWVANKGERYSSSVIDIVTCIRQAFSFLKEFGFPTCFSTQLKPSELTCEDTMVALALAVQRIAERYSELVSAAVARWLRGLGANAWTFEMPTKICIACNDIHTARTLLQTLQHDVMAHCLDAKLCCADALDGRETSVQIREIDTRFDAALDALTQSVKHINDDIISVIHGLLEQLVLCAIGDARAVKTLLEDHRDTGDDRKEIKKADIQGKFQLPKTGILKSFHCVYFPRKGKLYLSPEHLLFYSATCPDSKMVLPLTEILYLEKLRMTEKSPDDAVCIYTKDDQSIFFMGMKHRSKLLDLCEKQCSKLKHSLQKPVGSAESNSAKQLIEPLLSCLDGMLCDMRSRLYKTLFQRILRRFWAEIEEILCECCTGAELLPEMTEEQRVIVTQQIHALHAFFHADGAGISPDILQTCADHILAAVALGRDLRSLNTAQLVARNQQYTTANDASRADIVNRLIRRRAAKRLLLPDDSVAKRHVKLVSEAESLQRLARDREQEGPLLHAIHAFIDMEMPKLAPQEF
eukprot:TRINITY_DN1739_c0_g1_i1.p1 TRINITY_DN1739_c0_g1~~TRINITY_DN1739_c0_g1_i1.p1  ORF type:complete len:1332 (+),score=305.56 TRINITY_DN1739_c0_g1_i1:125-4120(+)